MRSVDGVEPLTRLFFTRAVVKYSGEKRADLGRFKLLARELNGFAPLPSGLAIALVCVASTNHHILP
jgi:hypothetical protein